MSSWPAREREQGAGDEHRRVGLLGLAIVDAIAKAHGGRASVRRKPRGSVFALQLPGFSASAAVEPQPSLERAVPTA